MKLPKVLIFSFYILLLTLYGCSTTNHASLPTMAYHDITSHYNAYFNSSEKLKGVFKLSEVSHKDKFDSVIPVYYYTDQKEFASYTSDLEDVVKRSTTAIQLHNVSNWTDDHFLLIGEANFLKGDYDKASASFRFITTQFKEGVDYVKVMKYLGKRPGNYVHAKKKKQKPEVTVVTNKDGTKTLEKVDKRPEITIWLHTPARSEALIWLIKTYTRQKKFSEAASVVTYVKGDDNFYKNYDHELDLAEADLKVANKEYSAAIAPLEKYLAAKKVKNKKRLTARPLFVLAQCYQATGNNAKAIENYRKVLKSRPNYDMEFYAKIKMAKLGRGGSADNGAMRSLLLSMSRDGKYKEYWDQIYYELALISLQENNKPEGKNFLHKSIQSSISNDDQKSLSFLKIADLDYEDEAYMTSKLYYDSTLSFMAKNDARYSGINERDKMLDNLVKQLNIIAEEDSMQKLAALPKEERARIIRDAIAQKEREAEEKKEAAEAQKQQNQLNNLNNNTQNAQNANTPGGSSWYFYNTSTRAQGFSDFTKKWGRRNLEENWRRKNKSSVTPDEEAANVVDTTADTKKDTAAVIKGTPEEKMEGSLPTTPDKLAKSTDRIVDAYYNAGTIYKDGMENYPKAEDMFNTLNTRYAKHKLLLESYYNLYLIALKRKQPDKAEVYKKRILDEYPESVIAKVLRDPNYINEARKKEHILDDYYQDTYNDYAHDKLDSAWYKSEMADNLFKPNPLSAKFQLIEALIMAKQNRLADYVQALNKLSNKSSDVQVKKTASDLLNLLNKSNLPQVDLSKDSTRRDSLNAMFASKSSNKIEIDSSLMDKLNKAKEEAIKKGLYKPDPTPAPVVTTKDTTSKGAAANTATTNTTDTTGAKPGAPQAAQEDTTSPYKRSDDAVHYFIIYIKDPATPQSAIMSTMAKVDAFNSTQFESKRLQSKQVLIDSKNKVLNFRQFKNKADVMSYFNTIKTQGQLFSDLKAGQYAITAISTTNFSILLGLKDVDEYNKFFQRVYGK